MDFVFVKIYLDLDYLLGLVETKTVVDSMVDFEEVVVAVAVVVDFEMDSVVVVLMTKVENENTKKEKLNNLPEIQNLVDHFVD
jgi:hypothetical protein